jgi:hypothetical protein
MMYRVIAIIGGALALAACSSSSDWLNLDALKPGPTMDTVRFESEPPGAEAKTSTGQTCTTPCAIALPASGPLTVTFTLAGFQPETQSLDVVSNTGSPPTLQPNPVSAELTAAAPPPKPKKPVHRRARTSAKPKPKPPAAAAAPTAAPAAAAPAPAPAAAPAAPAQQAPSPWPAAPAPQR